MLSVPFGPSETLEVGYNKAGEEVLHRGSGVTQVKLDRQDLNKLGMTDRKPGLYNYNANESDPNRVYQKTLDGTKYFEHDQTYIAQYSQD